jgi:hypothetical protein
VSKKHAIAALYYGAAGGYNQWNGKGIAAAPGISWFWLELAP